MDNSTRRFLFRICIISIAIGVFTHNTEAQNIISNIKGGSSLALNPGFKDDKDTSKPKDSSKIDTVSYNLGVITLTSSEKKIEFNQFSYFNMKNSHDIFLGASGSGKIDNSISSIFSDKNIIPDGEIKLRVGYRLYRNKNDWPSLLGAKKTPEEIQKILDENTRPASDWWLILDGGLNGASFKLFYPDSAFTKQIQKTNFTGYSGNIGLNYWNARILNNTFLIGATIGIKKTNNFDDLIESSREDTRLITDTLTSTTRKIIVKETVYSGSYKESTVYPFCFDIYFVPQKLQNIGFLGYYRTEISKTALPLTKVGVGLFFLKNQNAFNPVFGFTLDYSDIYNVNHSDDADGGFSKLAFTITTKINIINNQKRE